MSTKNFCDGCKVEVTPDNKLFRSTSIAHHFPETEIDFTFDVTFGSNASGNRWVNGDGDLCRSCFNDALRDYLTKAEEAELDAHFAAQELEALESESESDLDEDDGATVYTDEKEEECEVGDDIGPDGEVELEDE